MAQAVRDIRRRIKAVRSTQQITKAMQMVAAARLRKAQGRAVSARAYSDKLAELLHRLTRDQAHVGQKLLEVRPVKKAMVLVVTSDRGLAGAFNTNIFRKAEAFLAELRGRGIEVELLVVGRKGRDYFKRRGYSLAREEIGIPDEQLTHLARDYAERAIDRFSRKLTDEVIVVYSKFHSALVQRPTELRLLPVARPEGIEAHVGGSGGAMETVGAHGGTVDELELDDDPETQLERESEAAGYEADAAAAAAGGFETGAGEDDFERGSGSDVVESDLGYVYEPNARTVYARLLPKFVTNQFFHALLESRASMCAAQMTAMAAATDNADDLINKLTLEMHHARQASITQEIMELVGGADALRKR